MAEASSHHVLGRVSPGQIVINSLTAVRLACRNSRGLSVGISAPSLPLVRRGGKLDRCQSNERGSRYVIRASFGLVIFAVVGVALGGCTGGGGDDSAPPAAQAPAATASVTFQWDPVAVSDLAGYKIYSSTTPGTYGSPIATLSASTTTYQMTNLTKGETYFFAVSAYDTNGNESPFSNEQSRTIP